MLGFQAGYRPFIPPTLEDVRAAARALVPALLLGTASCASHPAGEGAHGEGGAAEASASAPATSAPDASFTETGLFVECLVSPPAGPAGVLRLGAEATYDLAAAELTLLLWPLDESAKGVTQTTVGFYLDALVTPDGRATTESTGAVMIPAQASPFEGEAATIADLEMQLYVQSPTDLCALLSGELVEPAPARLTPSPCVFVRTVGDVIPPLDPGAIHCP